MKKLKIFTAMIVSFLIFTACAKNDGNGVNYSNGQTFAAAVSDSAEDFENYIFENFANDVIYKNYGDEMCFLLIPRYSDVKFDLHYRSKNIGYNTFNLGEKPLMISVDKNIDDIFFELIYHDKKNKDITYTISFDENGELVFPDEFNLFSLPDTQNFDPKSLDTFEKVVNRSKYMEVSAENVFGENEFEYQQAAEYIINEIIKDNVTPLSPVEAKERTDLEMKESDGFRNYYDGQKLIYRENDNYIYTYLYDENGKLLCDSSYIPVIYIPIRKTVYLGDSEYKINYDSFNRDCVISITYMNGDYKLTLWYNNSMHPNREYVVDQTFNDFESTYETEYTNSGRLRYTRYKALGKTIKEISYPVNNRPSQSVSFETPTGKKYVYTFDYELDPEGRPTFISVNKANGQREYTFMMNFGGQWEETTYEINENGHEVGTTVNKKGIKTVFCWDEGIYEKYDSDGNRIN